MRSYLWIWCVGIIMTASLVSPSQAQTVAYQFKVAAENPAFEWFFLIVDAGKEQGIWAKHGLQAEFVPAAGSAGQLKERVDAGVKLGFVNTAEVPLARSAGTPVKIVAILARQQQGFLWPGMAQLGPPRN